MMLKGGTRRGGGRPHTHERGMEEEGGGGGAFRDGGAHRVGVARSCRTSTPAQGEDTGGGGREAGGAEGSRAAREAIGPASGAGGHTTDETTSLSWATGREPPRGYGVWARGSMAPYRAAAATRSPRCMVGSLFMHRRRRCRLGQAMIRQAHALHESGMLAATLAETAQRHASEARSRGGGGAATHERARWRTEGECAWVSATLGAGPPRITRRGASAGVQDLRAIARWGEGPGGDEG